MHRRAAERNAIGAVALALLASLAEQVRASGPEPALLAEVRCDPAPGAGKVQCSVRVRSTGGKYRWGDVIVLSAPPFAPALRTRVSQGDTSRRDAEGADFALALAATSDGSGDLRIRARAVVCGEVGCRAVQTESSGRVVVRAP